MSLQDRILLEHVPTEGENLTKMIEAMKKSVKVEVEYRRYGIEEPRRQTFDPYCIKLFKQRWYVLGHTHYDATEEKPAADYLAVYSFDRIRDLKVTDLKFKIDPKFDAKAYFDECFGVLSGDGTKVDDIIVRAYGLEQFYIRDLPLHSSQDDIRIGEGFTDYRLRLRPTNDFCTHVLSRGSQLEVLSPQWLADKIRDMHLEAAKMYDSEKK